MQCRETDFMWRSFSYGDDLYDEDKIEIKPFLFGEEGDLDELHKEAKPDLVALQKIKEEYLEVLRKDFFNTGYRKDAGKKVKVLVQENYITKGGKRIWIFFLDSGEQLTVSDNEIREVFKKHKGKKRVFSVKEGRIIDFWEV